ncbi:MAG: hypothetical protein ACRESZ_20155 [Methylococcales bacterium]
MPKPYTYTRTRVRRKGIKDGRNWYWKFWPLMRAEKAPYPSVEQDDPATFETELAGMAEANITDLSKQWEEEDRKLFPDYCRKLSNKKRSVCDLQGKRRHRRSASGDGESQRAFGCHRGAYHSPCDGNCVGYPFFHR